MFRVRDLALVAGLTALLIAYGYASSTSFRALTRSTDLFFLIPVVFAILTLMVRRFGVASLVGTVAGIVYLAVPGAPFPIHIAGSLISNGVAFDIYTRATGELNAISRRRIITAGAVGNLVMAIVGLALFQITGILTLSVSISTTVIIVDTLVGAGGALFGMQIAERLEVSESKRRMIGTKS